ncbi:MAG: LamG-like jellyroll fold domain-containing protein, partial [Luteolibacter sp.]
MFFVWTPSNGLTAGQDIRLGLDRDGLLRLEVTSGFARYDTTPLNDGQWHMVGLVVEPGDTTSSVQFYIDGSLVDPTSSSTRLIDTGATGSAPRDELYLGIGNIGGNQLWFGDLDDVRVNAEALTESELDALFTAMTAQASPSEWPLEEGSGTVTREAKSETITETLPAGVSWSGDTPGPGSSASLSFDKSSGFGTNLDSGVVGIGGANAKTISAWSKTPTTADAALFGYSPTNGSTGGADIRLLVNAAGQVRFEANVGNFALSSATVNDNAWHFVALVIPAGGTTADVSFYVDGSLSAPASSGGSATINTATGNQIRIGTDGNSGRHFLGLIDHVRIHNRALNVDELNVLRDEALVVSGTAYSRWIGQYFDGVNDSQVTAFDADPDGDSLPNGLEFFLGGAYDPTVVNALPPISSTIRDLSFELQFTRNDAAEPE